MNQASTQVSVTPCHITYDWCTNVVLVRGIGRKAIRVIIRPLYNKCGYVDETRMAINAARIAAKKGWRKVVVAPDDGMGDTIRAFNIHQYHNSWATGTIGIYLGEQCRVCRILS